MRYVMARLRAENRDHAYRIYISDSLYLYGQNKRLLERYEDRIRPRKIDKRTPEQIAADVIRDAGLKVTDNESF